jgi:hypothetical protein
MNHVDDDDDNMSGRGLYAELRATSSTGTTFRDRVTSAAIEERLQELLALEILTKRQTDRARSAAAAQIGETNLPVPNAAALVAAYTSSESDESSPSATPPPLPPLSVLSGEPRNLDAIVRKILLELAKEHAANMLAERQTCTVPTTNIGLDAKTPLSIRTPRQHTHRSTATSPLPSFSVHSDSVDVGLDPRTPDAVPSTRTFATSPPEPVGHKSRGIQVVEPTAIATSNSPQPTDRNRQVRLAQSTEIHTAVAAVASVGTTTSFQTVGVGTEEQAELAIPTQATISQAVQAVPVQPVLHDIALSPMSMHSPETASRPVMLDGGTSPLHPFGSLEGSVTSVPHDFGIPAWLARLGLGDGHMRSPDRSIARRARDGTAPVDVPISEGEILLSSDGEIFPHHKLDAGALGPNLFQPILGSQFPSYPPSADASGSNSSDVSAYVFPPTQLVPEAHAHDALSDGQLSVESGSEGEAYRPRRRETSQYTSSEDHSDGQL